MLLQLRVLGFGLLQDGDIGVGVFPEGKEILVARSGLDDFSLHGMSASEAEMRQCADGFVGHNSPPINDALELG
jgi:hypothetical protein